MTKETKMAADAELLAAFEAFKADNDARLKEIETRGAADPLLDEKLSKIERRLDTLSLKAARPDLSGEAAPIEAETERKEAWGRYLRAGDESGLSKLDVKSLSVGTPDQGGYVAPPELDRLIEARLQQASPMRQIASVRQTSSNVYKKPVGLGAEAKWAGEVAARTLLDDSFADIDDWLAGEVESAFSAQESAAFINGDGVNKPRGILNYTIAAEGSQGWGEIGSVAGDFSQTNAVEQLIDLVYAPESRFRANGRFVMNRRTVSAVRKLKDGDGAYLWQPGQGGDPATVIGYPVTEIEDMPDVAPGNAAIAFGDFRRGYLIVDRQGARVLRDPFSAKPYVLFYTTKRVGGGVQNFDAIKVMVF
ncbi:MAG: phage major capsid protein [Pseudomonadota bacterium]